MKFLCAFIVTSVVIFTLGGVENSNPLLKKKICQVKGLQKCPGTTENVFLNSKKDDFAVLLKGRSKPLEVMDTSNLIQGHSRLIKVKHRLEIKGKVFKGGFLIKEMTFEIMAKVAPAKLILVFRNSNFSDKISIKIATNERKKILVNKSLIKKLPLLDKIIIFSRDTSFTIGRLFLDACAEKHRKGKTVDKSRTTTIGKQDIPEPPSINSPDWEMPQDYYQLELDCCPEPVMITTTTEAIPSETPGTAQPPVITQPGPAPFRRDFTVILIIESGLFNKAQIQVIAGILLQYVRLIKDILGNAYIKIGVVTFADGSNELYDHSLNNKTNLFEGIKAILEKVKPVPFRGTADYTVGLRQACKLLTSDEYLVYNVLNMVLFMASSPHTGCHLELIKAVSKLKQKVQFIYSFGIGPDVVQNEIKLINYYRGSIKGNQRLDNYEFVCELSRHPQMVNNLNVLIHTASIYQLRPAESAIFSPKITSECLFENAPELPKILIKEKRVTQWKATKKIFNFTAGVCEGIFALIKDITIEAGSQVPFPRRETTKFGASLQDFLQFILEGKFALFSDSKSIQEKLEKWLDDKKGLGKFYSKLKRDFRHFSSTVIRMAGDKKVQCMKSLLRELSGNIEKLEDMLINIRKLFSIQG